MLAFRYAYRTVTAGMFISTCAEVIMSRLIERAYDRASSVQAPLHSRYVDVGSCSINFRKSNLLVNFFY